MGIATYRCTVLDVDDLTVAYRFWSEVTGLEIIGSPGGWHGRFGYLGRKDPWKQEFILQVVDTPKGERANRVHIDLTLNEGIDRAIEQIVALGGSVKKPPTLYPRPGSNGDEPPIIDWAVMQDPFGNEFCLVSDLAQEEIDEGRRLNRSRVEGGRRTNLLVAPFSSRPLSRRTRGLPVHIPHLLPRTVIPATIQFGPHEPEIRHSVPAVIPKGLAVDIMRRRARRQTAVRLPVRRGASHLSFVTSSASRRRASPNRP